MMQVRDAKTLVVDTLFPLLLIFVGVALSTIPIFREGVVRELDVSDLYPTPLSVATGSSFSNGPQIQSFYSNAIGYNKSAFLP